MPVKAKTKAKRTQKPAAKSVGVTISPLLQWIFVAGLTVLWAVLGLPALFAALTASPQAYGSTSVFETVLPSLLPLLLFVIAFWYAGKTETVLARLFRAALLTVLGLFGYIFLQMTLSYFPQLLGTGYAGDAAYRWQQIAVNAGTLVLFGGILLAIRWRRGNRG